MLKVGLVKQRQLFDSQGSIGRLWRRCLPAETIPNSGVLPGQGNLEFWQVEQRPFETKQARKFARKIQKQQMAVCGGDGWNYQWERFMQGYNPQTVFTGGFSLSLFVAFDFLLKKADCWRKKDIAILDADNELGRFAALALGTEARLLLLTGRNIQALELLSDEVLAKTGLAARIVSEEKALSWAELVFFTGEKKQLRIGGVQWDLAAMAGIREYSPGAKITSRFAYPAYGKAESLSAGWLSAMLLAQCEVCGKTDWQKKTPSEKIRFWEEGWQYFGVSSFFLLEKENGKQFYRIFG